MKFHYSTFKLSHASVFSCRLWEGMSELHNLMGYNITTAVYNHSLW